MTDRRVNKQEAFENLANAIIIQACEDHQSALRSMRHFSWDKRSKEYIRAKSEYDKCERFFRSEWFKALTTIDGEALLQSLKRREANDQQGIL